MPDGNISYNYSNISELFLKKIINSNGFSIDVVDWIDEIESINQTEFIGDNKMLLVLWSDKSSSTGKFIFHDKLRLTLQIIVDYESFNLTLL